MYIALIKASSHKDGVDFEHLRSKGINYLIGKGTLETHVSRSFAKDERRRPDCAADEYGVVTTNGGIYTFSVQPFEKRQDRELAITVTTSNEELTRNTAQQVVCGTKIEPVYRELRTIN